MLLTTRLVAEQRDEELCLAGRIVVAAICSLGIPRMLLLIWSDVWDLDKKDATEQAAELQASAAE